MELAAQTASETLELKHHYPYTPQQVFDAWTSKEAVGQWFGPHSHRCEVEEYEFRQGGRYRIRLIPVSEDTQCGSGSHDASVCEGEFVKIEPEKSIVMSFTWVEGAEIGDTLLSIEFRAVKGGTQIILTHERLPDEPMRQAHQGGWQGTLECLETYLAEQTA